MQGRVYQFIPDKGLTCFEAVPLDAPAGRVIWESPEASGHVLVKRRDTLLVWDSERRELRVVAAASGHVMHTVALPDVRHLLATSLEDGNLFAAGDDGRVIHLIWRN